MYIYDTSSTDDDDFALRQVRSIVIVLGPSLSRTLVRSPCHGVLKYIQQRRISTTENGLILVPYLDMIGVRVSALYFTFCSLSTANHGCDSKIWRF